MIRRIPRLAAEALGVEPLPKARSVATPAREREQEPPHDSVRALSATLGRALTLLLSEELRASPEHIVRVVERELLRARRASRIVLRVHPEDLLLLAKTLACTTELELRGELELCADPTLTRGGCMLSSNLGEVDASLETRLSLALTLLEAGARR